ncbi:MAG: 50S ribosomal protein L11 methyltransferase [Blastocatellia bacterium]|nr:50S ribosomal protein L11 methyltransferase [Blastocatellia bacterium]
MKIWHAIEVEIARVGETAATTQLWAFNTTGLEVSEDPTAPDFVTLRAWFNEAPDAKKLREQIVRGLKLIDLPEFALRRVEPMTIEEQDWLAEWKKGWEPILIGERLMICPSWKREQVKETDRIVVEIDPGMAFGTGTHETTRGCLEMLERYWPPASAGPDAPSLLDVGTGTGILAIAALKLAPAARVIGFDVDPEAIEVARENSNINGVGEDLELEVNRLSFYHDQAFDVVLANLTADVIIPLSGEFPRVTAPGGVLIASGILQEQGEDVQRALAQAGFAVLEAKPDGEWVTFALRAV